MLKVGVITDEIGEDLNYCLKVIDELGVEYIELQSLWGKEITDLNNVELKRAKKIIKKWNKKVCSISPHLFFRLPLRAKNNYKSYWGSFDEHLNRFKNAVRIAEELGTNLVRIFGFESEIWYGRGVKNSYITGNEWGNIFDLVLTRLEEPLNIAEKEGVTVIIETCFLNNFGSASTLKRFIERSGCNNLKALWDPCNTLYLCEEPYPSGYNIIKDYIRHVHVKDGIFDLPNYSFEFCAPGEGGVVDWPGILRALKEDNYNGVISLEPEYIPEGGTKKDGLSLSFNKLKELLNQIK